jgi:lysophospholipase L1-like esterase
MKDANMINRRIYIVLLALLPGCAFTGILAQDWANMKRFKTENALLDMPKENESRVVFMGNSITESWGSMVPGFFKGKPYVNRGISGQTTPQMLVRFRQDVIDLHPAVVVILAGTNDIAGNTGPMTIEETFGNIRSMAELAAANGIRIVLASVLPAFDYPWCPGLEPAMKIVKLNGMIKDFAKEQGMVYLDYFTAMADARNGLNDAYTYDGVHPNEAGYRVMAPLAEDAIREALHRIE